MFKWFCRKIVEENIGRVPKENSNDTKIRIDELTDDFIKQINFLLFKRCLPYLAVASIIILYPYWANGAHNLNEYSSAVDLIFLAGNATLLAMQIIAPISRRSEKNPSKTQAEFFLSYMDKLQKVSKAMNIARMSDTFKEFVKNEYDRFWAAKKEEVRSNATRIVNLLMFFALNIPVFYYKQRLFLQQQHDNTERFVETSKHISTIYSHMGTLKDVVTQLQQTVSVFVQ
ncbi:hypothetical protein [Pectinatus haikarae]|uniref:hypothetical protein n=1 Tax=Pectinatus haikarae TaxID=349096 RepID=UPI0018C55DE0|nr:hypothetical protein [Pectinatus haikarae]